jgi:hypothetical protein
MSKLKMHRQNKKKNMKTSLPTCSANLIVLTFHLTKEPTLIGYKTKVSGEKSSTTQLQNQLKMRRRKFEMMNCDDD